MFKKSAIIGNLILGRPGILSIFNIEALLFIII